MRHFRISVFCGFLAGCVYLFGCEAPQDKGRKELTIGSFLSDKEITRISDLVARQMVRDPLFYSEETPTSVSVVKVENNTNQYLLGEAKDAYLLALRTKLKQALKDRIRLVDPQVDIKLREDLNKWHLDEKDTRYMAVGVKDRLGVDYLLTATFDSLDKVVQVRGIDGKLKNSHVVELQMCFSLVDAENGELQWQDMITSSAMYMSRDFQD